ncbi:Rz1-like lysis system protein LysC [Arsukibacterium indicum]|uniref:Rz1-like lysis system protein LysC n=1 Tax=Arsukibacterium indicum TaxID=2848612 RepID=UPI003FD6DBB8
MQPKVETRTVTVTEVVYLSPPADLLRSCLPTTAFKVATNADGIDYSNWLESLLQRCNSQINLIEQWASGISEGQNNEPPDK